MFLEDLEGLRDVRRELTDKEFGLAQGALRKGMGTLELGERPPKEVLARRRASRLEGGGDPGPAPGQAAGAAPPEADDDSDDDWGPVEGRGSAGSAAVHATAQQGEGGQGPPAASGVERPAGPGAGAAASSPSPTRPEGIGSSSGDGGTAGGAGEPLGQLVTTPGAGDTRRPGGVTSPGAGGAVANSS